MTLILKKRLITTTTTEEFEEISNPTPDPTPDPKPDPIPDPAPGPKPDLSIDPRTSNGDVIIPYKYSQKNWNVEFDLDIERKIHSGDFLISITPMTTPDGSMPGMKLILEKPFANKSVFNLYDTSGKSFFLLQKKTVIDLKQNFIDRKLIYSPGDWGDNSYIYFFIKASASGVFYLFPKDSNGTWKRV